MRSFRHRRFDTGYFDAEHRVNFGAKEKKVPRYILTLQSSKETINYETCTAFPTFTSYRLSLRRHRKRHPLTRYLETGWRSPSSCNPRIGKPVFPTPLFLSPHLHRKFQGTRRRDARPTVRRRYGMGQPSTRALHLEGDEDACICGTKKGSRTTNSKNGIAPTSLRQRTTEPSPARNGR